MLNASGLRDQIRAIRVFAFECGGTRIKERRRYSGHQTLRGYLGGASREYGELDAIQSAL